MHFFAFLEVEAEIHERKPIYSGHVRKKENNVRKILFIL